MKSKGHLKKRKQRGVAMLAAIIFVVLFSALSVGFLSMASANIQISDNHHRSNQALNAALSGLECASYITVTTPTIETPYNYVSEADLDTMWSNLCTQLQNTNLGGQTVGSASRFTSTDGSGDQISTPDIPYAGSNGTFQLRFYRYDDSPEVIHIQCTGQDGSLARSVLQEFDITKDSEVLQYAIAGRGRMWITGDTTIHGDIYSAWDRTDISPFNLTDDSTVEGSINTCMSWQDIMDRDSFELTTYEQDPSGNLVLGDDKRVANSGLLLDSEGNYIYDSSGCTINVFDRNFENVDGEYNLVLDSGSNPIEGFVLDDHEELVSIGELTYGNPVEAFDQNEDRIISSEDELQGGFERANYSQPDQDQIPGLDISDYSTGMYYSMVMGSEGNGSIPSSSTIQREYFPHAAGDYTSPKSSSSRTLNRHVYENMDFTNVRLPDNRNALFKNCTFNEVLYIDCYRSTSSYYNNVRFEDCTFNGVIVTDVPNRLKWKNNALYFTGSATFNNTSSIQEATILAPHFNVNLGDANNGDVQQNDENVITGAVVGGIVDVRGNAQVLGTIISMCDTTGWSSGYVTNIGATLDDGGSETTSIEDIGTIEITPDPEQMLPSGITSPIIFKPQKDSYRECI